MYYVLRVKNLIKFNNWTNEFNQEHAIQVSQIRNDGRFFLSRNRIRKTKIREIITACKCIDSLHRVKIRDFFGEQIL